MLLRDDRQMAVNAVETLCFETADGYEAAASKTGTPQLASLFGELAQQRRQLAAELAAHIRALDDLPQQPDPDREAIGQVLSGIKALLSGDVDASLIDERMQAERKLSDAVRDTMQVELPEETRAMLLRIGTHAESARHALERARH